MKLKELGILPDKKIHFAGQGLSSRREKHRFNSVLAQISEIEIVINKQELATIIVASTLWQRGKDRHQALSELVETIADSKKLIIKGVNNG